MKRFKNYKLNLPALAGASKQARIKNLEKEISSVLEYFLFFNYPPTLAEIHTFLRKKASRRRITGILEYLVKKKFLIVQSEPIFFSFTQIKSLNSKILAENNFLINNSLTRNSQISNKQLVNDGTPSQYVKRYYKAKNHSNVTVQQYNNLSERQQISLKKLNSWRFRFYLKLLSLFPQIRLVGLSGSVAMLNAQEDHDIDLFIITAKGRLWTGRFISLAVAQFLLLRRAFEHQTTEQVAEGEGFPDDAQRGPIPQRASAGRNPLTESGGQHKNKICLNLFFDASNLKIPKFKQTEYVAHEVLQMKPLVDKHGTYLSFIDANRWVFDIFPNAGKISNSQFLISNQSKIYNLKLSKNLKLKIKNSFDWVEQLLKSFQLRSINKHKTTEIVTSSQLWFHPDDFEKKIK